MGIVQATATYTISPPYRRVPDEQGIWSLSTLLAGIIAKRAMRRRIYLWRPDPEPLPLLAFPPVTGMRQSVVISCSHAALWRLTHPTIADRHPGPRATSIRRRQLHPQNPSRTAAVQASSFFIHSWRSEPKGRTLFLHSWTPRDPKVDLLGSLAERRGASVELFGPSVELRGSRVDLFAPLLELRGALMDL